jgi:hypothetical protein
MDLQQVITQLEAQDPQKTAALAPPPSVDARLQGVLADTLEKTAASVTPPAATDDPVAGLMKMASELAGAEKEAELALANMLGQAFADGAIAKFAAYDAQVKIAMVQQQNDGEAEMLVKAAAEKGYADVMGLASQAEQEKIAGMDNDALVKVAAEKGYSDAMEKVAEAQFEQGFNEQVEQIHNVACGEFMKGAAETEMLLNQVRVAVGQ